jgi:hypothetical protein
VSAVDSAASSLYNLHLPLLQANAWTLALPSLRPALEQALLALIAVKSQKPDLVCAVAVAMASCDEAVAVSAAASVRRVFE